MPTKPTAILTVIGGQASRRYLDTFYDQHKSARFPEGRPWWGTREYSANQGQRDGFCGSDLIPGAYIEHSPSVQDRAASFAAAWHAPWLPEFKFFEFNYARNRITIRYDRVIAHDRAALNEYYRADARIANDHSWEPTIFGTVPRYAIRAIIGDPPRSPKIAEAAQGGDKWLLGEIEEVNESLTGLLGLTASGLDPHRVPIQGVAQPSDVITMTRDELAQLVADAAVKLTSGSGGSNGSKRQGASAEQMQRVRDARAAKRSAVA